jgi:tryptophan-rich sensory protein
MSRAHTPPPSGLDDLRAMSARGRKSIGTVRASAALLAFVVLVLGGGTLIGFVARPDAWYAALRKPDFMPPNWLFAPVWSVLYVLVALAGWRVWRGAPPGRRGLLALWILQLALNFLWSPLFFGAHRIGLALIVICGLLVAIAAFIVVARRQGETAAGWLMVPYAGWVAFATVLNASLFRLN